MSACEDQWWSADQVLCGTDIHCTLTGVFGLYTTVIDSEESISV